MSGDCFIGLAEGIIIGFSIAAPVGPIAILCVNRTIARGRLSGFVSGLGAATADAVYGGIAAFGVSLILNFLMEHQRVIGIIGGIFLLVLGVRIFFTKLAQQRIDDTSRTQVANFISTFILTLTNPMTLVAFAAVFAGLGITATGDALAGCFLLAGVFIGSASWWFLLTLGVSVLRPRIMLLAESFVNRVTGVVIFLFGIAVLFGVIERLRP